MHDSRLTFIIKWFEKCLRRVLINNLTNHLIHTYKLQQSKAAVLMLTGVLQRAGIFRWNVEDWKSLLCFSKTNSSLMNQFSGEWIRAVVYLLES